MKFKSGFTFIELLVVIAIIAIIGILAAVILGSLNDAREGGMDSKIKSEMVSLSKRAAVEESKTFTYDAVCGSGGVTQAQGVIDLITSIELFSEGPVVCNSDTVEYAASVPLITNFWCVDSTGATKEIFANLTTETVCP
jgi:prepilin-type N-terminal cleavage/methylation domain-containing protein